MRSVIARKLVRQALTIGQGVGGLQCTVVIEASRRKRTARIRIELFDIVKSALGFCVVTGKQSNEHAFIEQLCVFRDGTQTQFYLVAGLPYLRGAQIKIRQPE